MTVSMLKRAKDGSIPDEWIDISTNSFFEEQWLPIARQLKLQLVPLIWDPLHLTEEQRLMLINQLKRMRAFVDRKEESSSLTITKRIDVLITTLGSGNCEVFEFSFG